jgi:hypothetical protein
VERTDGGRDHLVHGAVQQRIHHPVDVVHRLEPKVLVDQSIHLLARHARPVVAVAMHATHRRRTCRPSFVGRGRHALAALSSCRQE